MPPSGSPATPDASCVLELAYAPDVARVLGPLVRGGGDPSHVTSPDGSTWRACSTPEGTATLRLRADGHRVAVEAWGEGSAWALAWVPDLLGAGDDPQGFPEELLPAVLADSWRRLSRTWRVPRSGLTLEVLVGAVLEQKVTGLEARRAWRALLSHAGDDAPGPTPQPMRAFPRPDRIGSVPSWQWHRWGVPPSHSTTIMRCVESPGRVQECADLPPDDARRRLSSIRGVGAWTVAEVSQRAWGDADAVSFGDFHLAHHVVYAFTGARDGTDEQMADLLEPFSGHRYRVQRLVEISGVHRPARGPRATITDHRRR